MTELVIKVPGLATEGPIKLIGILTNDYNEETWTLAPRDEELTAYFQQKLTTAGFLHFRLYQS